MSALQKLSIALRRLGRIAAQLFAGSIIALALLVGVARLLLPQADRFREDIRMFVDANTPFQIDFDMIGAGVSVYGPELRLSGTVLQWPDGAVIAQVDNIAVSLDLVTLVTRGKLLPARILIKGTSLEVAIAADGEWQLQGRPWRNYLKLQDSDFRKLPESRLQLEEVELSFRDDRPNGLRIAGSINRFDAALDDMRVTVSADIDPDAEYGRSLEVQGEVPLEIIATGADRAGDSEWNLQLVAKGLRLNKWLALARQSDLPVIDSNGNVDAKVDFLGTVPVHIGAGLDLAAVTFAQPDDTSFVIDRLAGDLDWRRTAEGWTAKGKGVRLERDSRRWPESSFAIAFAASDETRQRIDVNASFLRAEDLLPVARLVAAEQLEKAGFRGVLTGDFTDLDIALERTGQQVQSFNLNGKFAQLGFILPEQGIDISGVSGRVTADNGGGTLELDVRDGRFGVERLFRDSLTIQSLQGLAIWRAGPEGYRLLADDLRLVTPDGKGNAAIELKSDSEFANPVMDLRAGVSLDEVSAVPRYLPKVIPAKVLEWLDSGLQGTGRTEANFLLQGPLREFPYDHGEGVFTVDVDFVDARLDYAPDWPALQNASGRLVFDGVSMQSTRNVLSIAGAQLQNVDVKMADMRTGVLELKGGGQVPLDGLLEFLQNSPVGKALGPVFSDVRVTGNGEAGLDLKLPIRNLSAWRLRGQLVTQGATLGLTTIEPRFTDLTGTLTVNNIQITAPELSATLLGQPVKIAIDPVDDAQSAFSHRAFISGRIPVSSLQDALGMPAFEPIGGDMEIAAQAMFPGGRGDPSPFRLVLRSNLEGFSSRLPSPLNKAAESSEALNMELQIPERGTVNIFGSVQRGIAWALQASNKPDGWKLRRGTVTRGASPPELPALPGIAIYGALDSVDLAAWTNAFRVKPARGTADRQLKGRSEPWYRLFREVRVQIDEFYAIGHRFVDVDADVQFGDKGWDIDVRSPWAEGSLSVPYDFLGPEPVDLKMDRLLLIEQQAGAGDSNGSDNEDETDPRNLPGIKGRVRDFVLGNFRFGKLDLDVERTVNGLKSRQLRTTADSFRTDVSYDWLVVDNAQRSRLHLELRSIDLRDTLIKLGYTPLLEAETAALTADLLWEGGPGMSIVNASTGSLDLTIRNGVVSEVQTGTGRILGLLSITRLPSRLALDFKDMTSTGLTFDKITGTFRVDFGNAWTCNLGLEGPVADLGLVGRTGFVTQDYDQVAAVRPHVSNLAPVAGAFLAGPAVGITTLLVTQIFKKPLSSVGENYYRISGSFEDPVFTPVDRATLDTTSFGDCVAELPPLSPEEIRAIEELMATPPAVAPDNRANDPDNVTE
jgi:uncharacterized protein (TIGR02099 family)